MRFLKYSVHFNHVTYFDAENEQQCEKAFLSFSSVRLSCKLSQQRSKFDPFEL